MRAFLRCDATKLRRLTLGGLAAAWLCATGSNAAAADKAAVACIQAAEDGQTAHKAGALLHARELFAQCAARECPTMLRRDCAGWLEDADKQIPSVVLGAHDGEGRDVVDARASIDGALVRDHLDGSPVTLDPGTHVVRFERAGIAPIDVRVVVRAGEKNRAVLATLAPPAPPPAPSPPVQAPPPPRAVEAATPHHVPAGAWVLGGIGVVALGAFGYFGVVGQNDASTLHATCAPGCADAQVQSVRMKLIAADIGLGVGVVALAAATWIGVRGLTQSDGAAKAGWDFVVAPSVRSASAGVVVRF